MKKILFVCFLLLGIVPSGLEAPVWAEGAEGWQRYRFHIRWGIQTRTRQVWNGQAKVDVGEIVDITPFVRKEIPYDSILATKTSWNSTTYIDVEGIYLTVRAPREANVTISTETCDFRFGVAELQAGETRQEFDGDVEITNVTGQVLFRIAGLERGPAGKGTVSVFPETARVNTLGTWTLNYTAPEGGVPVGGGIRIAWHFTHSWGDPQFSNPAEKNYVTVKTDGESRLDCTAEHLGLFEYPFLRGRILVRVFDKPLKQGERIVVTLGDRSGGSPGFQAPVVAREAVLRVEECTEVPREGLPVYRRLQHLPRVNVLPELDPHRLFVVAPSLVQAGKPFGVKLVVEDSFRNVVSSFEGGLDVFVDGKAAGTLAAKPEHQGMLQIPGLVLEEPGPHWVQVRQPESGLSGESNPIKCVAGALPYRMVWGELHGHTECSDGYGSVDDYFRFTRERALLDFAAITDHEVELDAPDSDVAHMWREVNAAARRHHDPPRFCTLPAYEWSPARVTPSTVAPYGDHNVFYTREGMPLYRAEDPDTDSLQKLYRALEAVEEAEVQVIAHVGGAIGNWEYHRPGLENLAEIYSVHGGFEAFGELALEKGYRVGFVGASDSHNGQAGGFPPGNVARHFTHGGLTAAFVPELSREALLETFRRRAVYATSGRRIWVDFRLDGQPMGTVIETDRTPTLEAEVIGCAPLLFVEVIKNGRVIHTWLNDYEAGERLTLLWGNRVEKADLLDFDNSLWSFHLRGVDWKGGVKTSSGGLALESACSFDYPLDGVVRESEREIEWISQTRGDWDGVTLKVRDAGGTLNVTLGEYERTIDLEGLEQGLNRVTLGESDRLLIVQGAPKERYASFQVKDRSILYEHNSYYLRVLQADGEMAWSSPIWVRRKAE